MLGSVEEERTDLRPPAGGGLSLFVVISGTKFVLHVPTKGK